MNNRAIICSGGALGSWALKHIEADDLLIGVDRGALFLMHNGFTPHVAIGDFDSVSEEERFTIQQGSKKFEPWDPVHKDWTDTELAYRWAVVQRPREIVILGATGSRIDHSLANIHLLRKAQLDGVACRIIDEWNELTLIESQGFIMQSHYDCVSLLPLTLEVSGITLEGFQYPLQNARIRMGDSIGVSNVLKAKIGHIRIEEGLLLVIQSVDV